MRPLRLALLGDGMSDRALLPILAWSLEQAAPGVPYFQPEFRPRHGELAPAVAKVSEELQPDLLFVHRDAEGEPLEARRAEISSSEGIVRVVPVRMTEAWLLLSEGAIRKASGNPNGRSRLDLPALKQLERVPDPKALLEGLLLEASEFTGRRRKILRRDVGRRAQLVAEYVEDYSPLRELAAFVAFEGDLRRALQKIPST